MTVLRLYDKATHALRYWFLRRLPTCRQTAVMISQSLERPLSLRERVLMKLHLWVCIWCVRYFEQLYFMRDALRERGSQASGDGASTGDPLSSEARERLKRALSQRSH